MNNKATKKKSFFFINIFDACMCFLAPTYVPRNFRVMQVFGPTAVQFAWEPPFAADEANIRGFLKAYQVVILLFYLLFVACACLCRLKCFDLMIPKILYVLYQIFRRIKLGLLFLMLHQMVILPLEFVLKQNVI